MGLRFPYDSSLQNIRNNKVADLISDAMVKMFRFDMKIDLISDTLRSTGHFKSKYEVLIKAYMHA